MLNGARYRELIGEMIAHDCDLRLRARIAVLGGAAHEIERHVPIRRAANGGGGKHGGQLKRAGVVLFRRRLDQLQRILRRKRRVAANEQAPAQLELRVRIAGDRTLLQ